MKTKYPSILGIVVSLFLVASLIMPLFSVSTVQAGTNKWSEYPLPEQWDDGDFVLIQDGDVGPFDIAPDGKTIFAAIVLTDDVDIDDDGDIDSPKDEEGTWHVLKSTDGGYSWDMTEWSEIADADGDVEGPIVAIAVSNDYDDDEVVLVATQNMLYKSDDGGDEFTMEEEIDDITCLDVMVVKSDMFVVVGTLDGVYFDEDGSNPVEQILVDVGGVYAVAFSPKFKSDDTVVIFGDDVEVNGDSGPGVAFAEYDDDADDNEEWLVADEPAIGGLLDDDDITDLEAASIGLPGDFDTTELDDCVLFVGVATGDGEGDVFMVDDLDDTAGADVENLDVGEDILSVAVSGSIDDPDEIFILAGDYDEAKVYASDDSGDKWRGRLVKKQPTGDSMTRIVMATDFADNEVAYCATVGEGSSGFSCSGKSGDSVANGNKGKSWNQLSLVDTAIASVKAALGSIGYSLAKDETVIVVTPSNGAPTDFDKGSWDDATGSMWKTTDDGDTWERIFFSDDIALCSGKLLSGPPTFMEDAYVFAIEYGDEMHRSSDGGDTWGKTITLEADVHSGAMVDVWDSKTIVHGDDDGNIYATVDAGDEWEDAETPAGDPISHVKHSGNSVMVATWDGQIFINTDVGDDFEDLDDEFVEVGDADLDGRAFVVIDGDFANNHFIYGASQDPGADGVVRRAEVDMDDPEDSDWDDISDLEGMFFGAVILPGNIFYAGCLAPGVDADDEEYGFIRIAWPAAEDPDDAADTAEWIADGMPDGGMTGLYGGTVFPNVLFGLDVTTMTLYSYKDTLSSPVVLSEPVDEANQVGTIWEGSVGVDVSATWEEVKDADRYEYEVARDDDFSTMEETDDNVRGEIAKLRDGDSLSPNTHYYWRVRVSEPTFSPWSAVQTFTTVMGPGASRPDLVSPYGGVSTGGVDTETQPAIEWTSVVGATGYLLQLSQDASFAAVDIEVTTGSETAWQTDRDLGTGSTWFWRVKAMGITESPWSDVGSFTTMTPPPPPPKQQPPPDLVVEIPPPPPPPPTPGWVWVVIAVGTILVIAVIVLIARTRRVGT